MKYYGNNCNTKDNVKMTIKICTDFNLLFDNLFFFLTIMKYMINLFTSVYLNIHPFENWYVSYRERSLWICSSVYCLGPFLLYRRYLVFHRKEWTIKRKRKFFISKKKSITHTVCNGINNVNTEFQNRVVILELL